MQKLSTRTFEDLRPAALHLPHPRSLHTPDRDVLSHLPISADDIQARGRDLTKALKGAHLPGRARKKKRSPFAEALPYLLAAAAGALVTFIVMSGLGRNAAERAQHGVRAGAERLPGRARDDYGDDGQEASREAEAILASPWVASDRGGAL